MVGTLKLFDTARMAQAAPRGFSLATDMADWLVRRGVPFARAHDIAGAAVQHCEAAGIELSDLAADSLAQIAPELDAGVLDVLTIEVRWPLAMAAAAPSRPGCESSWPNSTTLPPASATGQPPAPPLVEVLAGLWVFGGPCGAR